MKGERRCKKRERPWIFRDFPGFLDLYVRFYFRNISHSTIIKNPVFCLVFRFVQDTPVLDIVQKLISSRISWSGPYQKGEFFAYA
jgi:hypothetical protein